MRIIAGEHGGRRIEAPEGEATRPMLDRVRESLFATLGNLVDDARVLDLFAGGGSLALEALSRGARRARIVERDPRAFATLRRNLAALGYGPDRALAVRGSAVRPSSWAGAPSTAPAEAAFDLVLLDPPFPTYDDPVARERLYEAARSLIASHLAPGGVLVFHAPTFALETLRVADFARAARTDVRPYGGSGLVYVFPRAAPPGGAS